MKLYYSPGACSLAPHIVLNEIGEPYEIEKVDLASKTTEKGDNFHEVNSKGYVPTLELAKGEVLTEVSTILQYLADRAEKVKLLPKFGSMERYRAMESLNSLPPNSTRVSVASSTRPCRRMERRRSPSAWPSAWLARRTTGQETLSAWQRLFGSRRLCLHGH